MWLQLTACLPSSWRLQVLERYNAQIEARSALLELVPPGLPDLQSQTAEHIHFEGSEKHAPGLMTCPLCAARATCPAVACLHCVGQGCAVGGGYHMYLAPHSRLLSASSL